MSYLLTICIPTYNRETFLAVCLESIVSQLVGLEEIVELLISDNASTDNTSKVVASYNDKFPHTYIKNIENKGSDYNIAQLFSKANGKYVWIFGDDDFLLPNSLNELLSLLRKNDVGSVYLNALFFSDVSQLQVKNVEKLVVEVYEKPIEYYKEINYYTTFITSNVINKDALSHIKIPNFEKTSLVQLSWTIPVIFSGKKNIIVKNHIIASKSNNTGGYKLITTFAKNYDFILDTLVNEGYDKKIIPITKNNLLNSFFPHFIYKILYENNNFEKEDSMSILFSHYWKYSLYWKNIFPIYVKFRVKKILFLV